MKATDFAYWLQGLFELAEPIDLSARQTELIRRHLEMVFIHDIDRRYPVEEQAALDAVHNPPAPVSAVRPVPSSPIEAMC